MLRKKLAVIAAAALPLTGIAVAGGIQVASAGAGPTLTCTSLSDDNAGPNPGGITFNNGTDGISLSSNAAQTAELLSTITTTSPGATATSTTQITINKGVVAGQTLSVAGFTNTAVVASFDETAGVPGIVSPDVVTLVSPGLTGGVAVKGTLAKAKAAVTVNATDGTNNTTAFQPTVTLDVNETLGSCVSSTGSPGSFAPTQVNLNATSSASNSASGLEGAPGNLDGTISLPPIGADYVQPVATTINFDTPADNKLNLLAGDAETFAKGAVVGDYGTTKGAFSLAAADGNTMVVCTDGELAALSGTSVGGVAPSADSAHISVGANPLVVCDSGSSVAYSSIGGLAEIEDAELSPGATQDGGDGTAISAIYQIQPAYYNPNVI